jgi:predicted NBD/HSP70 family sugar kinase
MENVFAGFDLGGSFLKYGMGTARDFILYHHLLPVTSAQPEAIYALLNIAYQDLQQHLTPGQTIKAAVLGSPGTVNSGTGEICGISPNLPEWKVPSRKWCWNSYGKYLCL